MGNELNKEVRQWGLFCHASTLLVFVGIPFANIVGPLVIWMIKKEEFEGEALKFITYHGKEALNFQISMTIYVIVTVLLCFVLIGLVLLPIVLLADIILTIIAIIKSSEGQYYRYPFTIRFLK